MITMPDKRGKVIWVTPVEDGACWPRRGQDGCAFYDFSRGCQIDESHEKRVFGSDCIDGLRSYHRAVVDSQD